MGYQPIEQHGVVGDLHTVALVATDGSVDFMCFPRFDSPTIFAALLDERNGGRFQIAPTLGSVGHNQLHLPDSNILLSRFVATDGVAELSDFMPAAETGDAHALVRRVKTVRGEVRYRMVLRAALRLRPRVAPGGTKGRRRPVRPRDGGPAPAAPPVRGPDAGGGGGGRRRVHAWRQ